MELQVEEISFVGVDDIAVVVGGSEEVGLQVEEWVKSGRMGYKWKNLLIFWVQK